MNCQCDYTGLGHPIMNPALMSGRDAPALMADIYPYPPWAFPLMSGLLTAGSRVLFQGETEGGVLDTSRIISDFQRYLQQRGLRVESLTYEDLGVDWTGVRSIRVWAQVITPVDRADDSDLTGDMTQDLQRASQASVNNAALSIMVLAGVDESGRPTYPGGQLSPPNTQPGPAGKSFFDDIAQSLSVTKSTAQSLVVGGGILLLVLVMKR